MNKIWSPSFNLKHSSSDYITRKRKQTLYYQSQTAPTYAYTNNETSFYKFPSYWMRRNIVDGKTLCTPCPDDVVTTIEEIQLKQYE